MSAHRDGVADAALIGGGVIALLGPALMAQQWPRSALVLGGSFTVAWLAFWTLAALLERL